MKPIGSRFPQSFDGDDNLYLVKDGLQTPLAIDYYPGNRSIVAETDLSNWPNSGIITLVEQNSSPSERAISFHYSRRTNREFLDIELLPDSINCFKPKRITNITMQVMSDHREALKNGIIAIEKSLGTKHETENIEGRTIFSKLNFLKKILYVPQAWFEADNLTGAVPFKVKFTFTGTGTTGPVGEVVYIWRFNDEEATTLSPEIEKTFLNPEKVTVSLTVINYYGEDTVTFVDMINAKGQAPEKVAIKFLPLYTQICINTKIRTPINQPVTIEIPTENERTYAVANEDQVVNYTWSLGDDLSHNNAPKAKAVYTIGGEYDMVIRTDTNLGSYRITTYENCIDVVEPTNLWIWDVDGNNNIQSHEFGLVSEVLKTSSNKHQIYANDSFIDENLKRQRFEFWRNNGAASTGSKSGEGGETDIFWASGRTPNDSVSEEEINFLSYNGFADVYTAKKSIQRPWNWTALASDKNIYFVFGTSHEVLPTVSTTNQLKTIYELSSSQTYTDYLDYRNYKNGANELMYNPGGYDKNLDSKYGHYSICRSAWKDQTGYILRNIDLGEYLLLSSFYKTEGVIGDPFQNIIKVQDMPGDDNKDGALVALSNGIYFFNNLGNTYCFNDNTMTWELVPPHNKLAKSEFDGLLAASDKESRAYISIGDSIFFKFNEMDMSYATLQNKSLNKKWLMTVF